jgi:putative phage-type endonuclease
VTEPAFDVIACPTRAAWLAERKKGIGASEAAVLVGEGYGTLADLWAQKCGILSDSLEETERMEWGLRLEPQLAQAYEDRSERLLLAAPPYTLHRSRAYPWAQATLDREILALDERGPGALELKCGDSATAKDWQDDPPLRYLCQLQWQLLVTGWQWGSIAVLLGGNRFLWMDVERNDEVIALLVERGKTFWEFVTSETPPPLEYERESTADLLEHLYSRDDGTEIALPDEALLWDEQRLKLKDEQKAIYRQLDEIENRLKERIGEHTYGVLPSGDRYSWKRIEKAGYTVAPVSYRELRRLKSREGR